MRQTLDFGDIKFIETREIVVRGNLQIPKNQTREIVNFVFPTDLFSGSLILYLVLFLIENIFPGVVSREFSLNYLLVPVLVFGVLSSVFPQPETVKEIIGYKSSDILLSFFMSIIGAGLIYYKVDLELYLRLIIALVSGLLILMISALVVLPEDFKIPKITIRKKYLWILLLIPVTVFVLWRINRGPSIETVVRIAPEKYTVVLVNKSGNSEYTQTYKNLLINNGYKNVIVDEGKNIAETTSKATIMYDAKDSEAGNEIKNLIGLSYKDTQTSPLIDSQNNKIVIILK